MEIWRDKVRLKKIGEVIISVLAIGFFISYWILPVAMLFSSRGVADAISNIGANCLLGFLGALLAYLFWWKVGRFKWLFIGIIFALYLANVHAKEDAFYGSLAAVLILLWRDEALRHRFIEQAKDEARDDAIPKPWFGYRLENEYEAIFGKQRPPLLSNDEETAMERFAQRIKKKL